MSYTSKDIKNIVAEILENKKDKGGVKSLYFVGCGGSLGALLLQSFPVYFPYDRTDR